jgi:hypothetical protein
MFQNLNIYYLILGHHVVDGRGTLPQVRKFGNLAWRGGWCEGRDKKFAERS